jgi:hypothetical protein
MVVLGCTRTTAPPTDEAAQQRMKQLWEEAESHRARADDTQLSHGEWSLEYCDALELWCSAIQQLDHYIDEFSNATSRL